MKLVMHAFTHGCDIYELSITEEYVKSLNEHFRKFAVNPDDVPEISVELIKTLFGEGYAYDTQPTYEAKSLFRGDATYLCYFYEAVIDAVSDDLWSNCTGNDYTEVDDTETEVIDKED